jgi:hypothetical protein
MGNTLAAAAAAAAAATSFPFETKAIKIVRLFCVEKLKIIV